MMSISNPLLPTQKKENTNALNEMAMISFFLFS